MGTPIRGTPQHTTNSRLDGVQSFLPGSSYLTFQGNFSGYSPAYVNVFTVITPANATTNSALLCVDQGLVVKKDIEAGGILGSEQGALLLGHGLISDVDPPKISLTHSDTYLTSANGYIGYGTANPQSGEEGQTFLNTGTSPNLLYQFHNGAWISLGDVQNWNGGWPTLYITRADGITPANMNLANLYAQGVITGSSFSSTNNGIGYYSYNGGGGGGNNGGAAIDEWGNFVFQNPGSTTNWEVISNSTVVFAVGATTVSGFSSGFVSVPSLDAGSTHLVYAMSNGILTNSSSSLRYKTNIEAIIDASWIYNLRPVNFDWTDANRAKADGRQIGLIAEEVYAQYPMLTWNNQAEQIEGVHYEYLSVAMLVEMQKLKKEVDKLKAKLAS